MILMKTTFPQDKSIYQKELHPLVLQKHGNGLVVLMAIKRGSSCTCYLPITPKTHGKTEMAV